MRLTTYTDYALRLLMLLALKDGEAVTIKETAAQYGISKNHLMKIAHRLGQADMIETTRGRGGGLRLARDPSDITIGDIIRLTEEDFILVECFDDDRSQCIIAPACRLKSAIAEARDAFLAVLDGYSLADLVAQPRALQRLLDEAAA